MDTPLPSTIFDPDLISRYDGPGPRYTSYPTALSFHEQHGLVEYTAVARASNAIDPKPLSLYVHVPFCESPCFYCGCNKVITRDHRRAQDYLSRLYVEIDRQGELFDRLRRVDQLHFGGGTPTFLGDEQLDAVLRHLAAKFSLRTDEGREYSIEIDPRTVSSQRLEVLVALGFNRISLGIQDFDLEVQKAVNRVQSAEDAIALIHKARELRIGGVSVDLIYGLPRQTQERFARTLERVVDARPDRIAAYSYAHMPHLFKAQRQIKAEDLVTPAEKLGLLGLTVERLTEAGYVYVGMDHFALPTDDLVIAQADGTLQRNFQGYSIRAECDLVAIGVSAISKIGGTYAQNAKTLPDYYRLIDGGTLAVQRGITLSRDDRLRRDVIQRLMCATRLDFDAIGASHRIDFEGYFAEELRRLERFEADGLVQREAGALRITPKGRLLMRNIAMIFDAHLKTASAQDAPAPSYSRVV